MKYVVIGAGGVGGCIAAYMTEAGKNVTVIARGAHLKAMQTNGLRMETTKKGNYTVNVRAMDMDAFLETQETADVIFVCVKGYSLDGTYDFIRNISNRDTIVIPLLNIYGTGAEMQKHLDVLVTNGCIYVAAEIKEPGCIWMNGDIFRVVFGVRNATENRPGLEVIAEDLKESDIEPLLSDNIARDTLKKFAYVSPAAACGEFYHVAADAMQRQGEERECFKALIGEVDALAKAMNIDFGVDIVATNVAILDRLSPTASTSMQRDIAAGKSSEVDGLVYSVVRLGQEYGVETPQYSRIAEELQRRGLK